jgi:arylsulfatase A-like enzyme
LFDELKRLGLWDKTIVVVTADHGEEFFEHGGVGHQRSLYDEVVRIPLVMRWPKGPRNRIVDGQVRIVDVFPTLVHLTGIAESRTQRELGMSCDVEPFTRKGASPPLLPAFSELHVFAVPTDQAATRHVSENGAWKAIEVSGNTVGHLFFDLGTDPGELHSNLNDPRASDALKRLGALRDALLELSSALAGSTEGQIPEEIRRTLKTLGYIMG